MSDRYDDEFENRLARELQSYADGGGAQVDPYAVADRAMAARRRGAARWFALAGGGAVLAGAVVLGLIYGGWRDDGVAGVPSVPPSVSAQASATPAPSPSAEPTTAPTARPSRRPAATAPPCATVECPPDLPILPGRYGEVLIDELDVWAAPGDDGSDELTLTAGSVVHVGETRLVGDDGWYRIQFQHFGGALEWLHGWLPGSVDGAPTLGVPEGPPPDPLAACVAQSAGDGWLVAYLDPSARQTCGMGVSVTLEGYLGEVEHAEQPIFSGEPAWLANEPELVLWSAVGPAADGFQIPVHIDPGSSVTYSEDILSDREGVEGTRVFVAGHFADAASEDCRREPRIPGFLPMSAEEQFLWCQQQFVADQIHVGDFIEPDLTDLDTCENLADGYRLNFPDAWYSNTDYDGIEGCRFFNPGPFVVTPGREAAGVAITVRRIDGGLGTFDHIDGPEELTIAGRPVTRYEVRGALGEGGVLPPWVRIYTYVIQLTDDEGGARLVFEASNGALGDYETNRAVLDAMVQTLELTGTE